MISCRMWCKTTHLLHPVCSGVASNSFRRNPSLGPRQTQGLRTDIGLPPPSRQYVYNVHFDNSPHDVASCFRKATFCVSNLIGVTWIALLAVARWFHANDNPNIREKDFQLQACKESIKSMESRHLRTKVCDVVNKEDMLPLFNRFGDLCIRSWFGIGENLAVDVLLGTSFINQAKKRCSLQNTKSSLGPRRQRRLFPRRGRWFQRSKD